jgi:hypothetical protein
MNMSLLPSQLNRLEELHDSPHGFYNPGGGHMQYGRTTFVNSNEEPFFVKAHVPNAQVEAWRQDEMKYFLEKEYRLYIHLQDQSYPNIPNSVIMDANMLIMDGLISETGWHWRAPRNPDSFEQYVGDVLAALNGLSRVAMHDRLPEDEISLDIFYNFGWDKLNDIDIQEIVTNGIKRWSTSLLPQDVETAHALPETPELAVKRADIVPSVLNHHDARQANIAWHPKHGVKIVDWSWAEEGLINGDSTMFLLDLAKAGHDISSYMDQFNPTYAKLVLGYWLNRSQTSHPEGHDVVRMHQFISALKAARLLLNS